MPKKCKYLIASSGADSYITNPQGQQLLLPLPAPLEPLHNKLMDHKARNSNIAFKYVSKCTARECTNPLNRRVCGVILSHSKIPLVGQEGVWVWRTLIPAGNLEMFVRIAKPMERVRERQKSLKFQ